MSKFTKGGKMGVRMNISPKGDYDDDADGKNGSQNEEKSQMNKRPHAASA